MTTCATATLPTTGHSDLSVSIGAVLFEGERENVTLEGGRGMTIREVLDDFPEPEHHQIVVISRDIEIPPDQWGEYVHDHDTPLYINVVPKNRRLLRIVAFVALSVFSPGIATALVGAGASTFTKLLVTTGIQLLGAVAIERLLGERPASITTDPQRFGVGNIQNRLPDRQTPVPVVMGTHRMAPYFAAQPYAYVVDGERQGYRALFDFGYGPLTFDTGSFRFGDQSVSTFPNARVITHDGIPGTFSRISAFSESHDQRSLNRELLGGEEDAGGGEWHEFEFAGGVNRVTAIVVFNGLITISDRGDRSQASVSFEVQTRPAGGSWGPSQAFTATAETTSEHFFEIETAINHAGGQWRIRRTTRDHKEDNNVSSDSILSAVDFITPVPPVNARGRALAFVEVIANENLNTTIQTFNGVVTRRISRFEGGRWTEPSGIGASNPAWLFADVLRGQAMARPLEDGDLDTASLSALASHCDDNDYFYNAVWTDQRGVWDRLNQIAAAGRASATFVDGNRYGVVIDRRRTVPVDLITPKDALSFSAEKTFEVPPHGFRARFNDADNGFMESEIVVYRDGFNEANATDVRTVDAASVGATTVNTVHRFLRYLLAVTVLRPEAFTVRQDIKNLRLQRGDYVDLQHDAPLVGLGSGRLTQIGREGGQWTGFSLDEFVPLRAGERHTARFQTLDGNAVVVPIIEAPRRTLAARTVTGDASGTLGA